VGAPARGSRLPGHRRVPAPQVPARCVPQLQLECLATGAPSVLLCSRSATKARAPGPRLDAQRSRGPLDLITWSVATALDLAMAHPRRTPMMPSRGEAREEGDVRPYPNPNLFAAPPR